MTFYIDVEGSAVGDKHPRPETEALWYLSESKVYYLTIVNLIADNFNTCNEINI